jgi:hypothetical protein
MNIRRLVCILLPLAAVACQLPGNPSAPTPPGNDKSDSKKGTITVTIDGREARPKEAEALGALGTKLLSDAIQKAINEGVQELLKKLDVGDPIETDLFSAPFGPETSGGNELWSVYLMRPGKETKEPCTIVLSRDGKPVIRFTRATAPVERPVAIMTLTFTKNGHLTQRETFLVYSNGKWKQYRASERSEELK